VHAALRVCRRNLTSGTLLCLRAGLAYAALASADLQPRENKLLACPGFVHLWLPTCICLHLDIWIAIWKYRQPYAVYHAEGRHRDCGGPIPVRAIQKESCASCEIISQAGYTLTGVCRQAQRLCERVGLHLNSGRVNSSSESVDTALEARSSAGTSLDLQILGAKFPDDD